MQQKTKKKTLGLYLSKNKARIFCIESDYDMIIHSYWHYYLKMAVWEARIEENMFQSIFIAKFH